ncbi:MAG: hypothetical protein WAN50_00130 [Minisyncoccia bacterium]
MAIPGMGAMPGCDVFTVRIGKRIRGKFLHAKTWRGVMARICSFCFISDDEASVIAQTMLPQLSARKHAFGNRISAVRLGAVLPPETATVRRAPIMNVPAQREAEGRLSLRSKRPLGLRHAAVGFENK